MSITKPLTDDEAMNALSPNELAIGEAALAGGPIEINLAYLYEHPKMATIDSLPELGRRLNVLKEDVRALVLRRLSGQFMATVESSIA